MKDKLLLKKGFATQVLHHVAHVFAAVECRMSTDVNVDVPALRDAPISPMHHSLLSPLSP